jgi:hypothetical protein
VQSGQLEALGAASFQRIMVCVDQVGGGDNTEGIICHVTVVKISAYFLVFTIDFCLLGGLGFLAA